MLFQKISIPPSPGNFSLASYFLETFWVLRPPPHPPPPPPKKKKKNSFSDSVGRGEGSGYFLVLDLLIWKLKWSTLLWQLFNILSNTRVAFTYLLYNALFSKGLKYDRVLEQLNESLKRLKKDSVELFYLHAPDHHTPIEETLEAVNHLYKGDYIWRGGKVCLLVCSLYLNN